MAPMKFPYDQIETWIADQLPGWRWVDAIPSGFDPETQALRCKIEGRIRPNKWERKFIWLFPDGSINTEELG